MAKKSKKQFTKNKIKEIAKVLGTDSFVVFAMHETKSGETHAVGAVHGVSRIDLLHVMSDLLETMNK